jgi:hypothetical protein
MAKRKAKKKKPKPAKTKPGWYESLDPQTKRRAWRWSGTAVALVVIAAGASVGMARLDQHVHQQDRFSGPPEIVLVDVPAELEPIIREGVDPLTDGRWIDPDLCVRVADQLLRIAWVRKVNSIRRIPPGRIEVRCAYRTPAAMVQVGGEFVLIDAERVRLPGRYPYSPALPLIQGVAAPPPAPGVYWRAADLAAAMAVATRLEPEPFANQVTAIRVHNYKGRENAQAAHIELATDRAAGRIIWGSAPGEEIEENSATQKLAIMRRNYEQYGRIDAGHTVIDISTFPDRFTTPLATAAGQG